MEAGGHRPPAHFHPVQDLIVCVTVFLAETKSPQGKCLVISLVAR